MGLAMTMLEKINKDLSSSKGLGYAKISRDKLRNIAKAKIDLTRSAIDLLLAMSRYVDSTSRIVIDLDMLSRKMNMQRKTFKHVMSQLLYKKLIYRKDGAYYSNFHTISKGNKSSFEYINPQEEFTSPTFLNLTLNQKRLLSYFLTSSMLGSTQIYNVVKLYRNKLKENSITEKQSGLDIFPTLKELLENLSVLINNDQVVVQLTNGPTKIELSKDCGLDIKETLLSYFGFSEEKNRSRTTVLNTYNEIIKVKISNRICNTKENVIASEYELDQFAMANNFSAYDLGIKQMKFLIGVKNDLIKFAGDTGASIYRRTIQKYFSEKKEMILTYAEEEKATNYYVDYYLLPEIRSILSDAALHQNIMSSGSSKFTEILTNGYILPINSITSLVAFYVHKGSKNENELALLDKDLVRRAINKTNLTSKPWMEYKEKVSEIKYNFRLLTTVLPYAMQNELFDYCLDNSLLTQENKIKDIVRILEEKSSDKSLDDIENKFKFAGAYAEAQQINSSSEVDRFKELDQYIKGNSID